MTLGRPQELDLERPPLRRWRLFIDGATVGLFIWGAPIVITAIGYVTVTMILTLIPINLLIGATLTVGVIWGGVSAVREPEILRGWR